MSEPFAPPIVRLVFKCKSNTRIVYHTCVPCVGDTVCIDFHGQDWTRNGPKDIYVIKSVHWDMRDVGHSTDVTITVEEKPE